MDEEYKVAVDLANEIRKNYRESNALDEMGLALRLVNAGYRKDPYPTGKTKDQLIEIIEGLQDTNAQLTIKIAALKTALKGVKP